MSGTKPTSGKVRITNGVVQISTKLVIGDYYVIYNSNSKKCEAIEKGNRLTCNLQEGTSQKIGSKYTCHLDSDRTFYVLETNENEISLIMDRNFTDENISSSLAWCIDGGNDNTTCKNINSEEEGTPLKHIQDIFGINVDVSFPTKEQLEGAYTETMPTWLYDYLNGTTNSLPGVYGYWTTSIDTVHSFAAWYVRFNGIVYRNNVDKSDTYGLRPVITVTKSQLD